MLPKLLLFLLILELLLWQSQCSKSSNPYTIRQEATSFLSDTLKASTTLLPFLYSSQIGRVSAAGISSGQQSDSNVRYFDSIEETAQFILANCGTIVDAVNATGHLLYRGDDRNLTLQTPNVQRLSPDLLSFDTYKSPVALDYFNSIDGAMASRGMLVRPSIGHIATSDIVAAGQWGVPVSVWPIDPFSYLSYKYDTNLWEEEWATPQGKRGPFFWKSEERLNKFIDTELLYNKGLEAALTKNGEVHSNVFPSYYLRLHFVST